MHSEWELYLYLRYVDDANFVAGELPLGARLDNGKVVIRQEMVQEDANIPGDLRTARVIQEITNGISSCIEDEIDCPSLHENRMMPILDR